MLSKPKLIGAAVAVTASLAAAALIGTAVYNSGDSSPPAAAAVEATEPATPESTESTESAESADTAEVGSDADVAGARPVGDTPPMDEAMDHMLDAPSTNATTKTTSTSTTSTSTTTTKTAASRVAGASVFLVADLNGRNEVPVAGGPKVGDRDGRALQVIRIRGNTVSFAVAWKGIAAPTANHIHEGGAGVNGPIKVDFFGKALPAGVRAVTGSVTVNDPALLDNLANNPGKFYANLHTAEFPGGAVRAQYRRLDRPVNLERAFDFGRLVAKGSGAQEVPVAGGPAAGDRDGRSVGFVWAKGARVDYSIRWSAIAPPTLGHIHQGKAGVNGAVVVDLFGAEGGLPASITGVAGSVTGLDPKVVTNLGRTPDGFYTNLHTAEFPGGAVRGQLARLGTK